MDIIVAPGRNISITRPGQGFLDLAEAGFENILLDLSLLCRPGELENVQRDTYSRLRAGENGRILKMRSSKQPEELFHRAEALSAQCRKAGLHAPIARAPFLRTDTKRRDLDELLFSLACESIRACSEAGGDAVIISPLSSVLDRGEEWETNRDFYRKLIPAAREYQVRILLHNRCRDVGGHLVRGVCSDANEAASWVDRLNEEAGEERFGFCMDVGICSLCGQNIQAYAYALGNRIKAVILRDNDGHRELSALPFTCTSLGGQCRTDWLSLIRGLREIEFDGRLVLDFSDTAAAFSPLLRPLLMKLAKAAADYFQWQIQMERLLKKYSSVVLFGAGNMCRNYMKCYGELCPPLFTCDNNRMLWGTTFCGLEVRPPERLKELSADCVILICNIYYREIERQLRDMGIENPIGFFNDEYMPSFYFDRLEGDRDAADRGSDRRHN